ncbi:hypothetical protein HO404_00870 [Streptococcus suis]|uniref:hypothetical protein n=1 Tax=Streptococcus parasuis TaxID=1501662 RepID=UPI00041351F1|nr:hypothetical protein [Streptococcus suis]BCP62176.1 hypothetical protein SUT380_13640 [Streptococcus parasuis]NQI72111.1 hypothetical protein [Streptococcus suis]NQM54391.1 hypothetical protein [Streptococcus suis]NQP33288.1 hypothetical protein [Streptococcus suis]
MFRNLLKRYPEQALLFLYNAGIFAWLKTSGQSIMNQLGVSSDWVEKIPAPVRDLAGNSLAGMESLLNSSAWGWLIVSMILLVIIRFVKGLIKFMIMVIIIGGGLYLLWQNKELLNGLG